MSNITVGICSDLHLDFEEINPEFFDWRGDVLIIAGDLAEIDWMLTSSRAYEFLKGVDAMAPAVLYVPGNHEYYNGDIKDDVLLWEFLDQFRNIRLLQNDTFVIGEIQFIGSTLWTDLSNPIDEYRAASAMGDYRFIRTDSGPNERGRRLVPYDTTKLHEEAVEYIRAKSADRPSFVISHHAPSPLSIAREFQNNALNPAFVTDLSDLILDQPNIIGWAHGHVHNKFDYTMGHCGIYCNPRGYPMERPSSLPPYTPMTKSIQV